MSYIKQLVIIFLREHCDHKGRETRPNWSSGRVINEGLHVWSHWLIVPPVALIYRSSYLQTLCGHWKHSREIELTLSEWFVVTSSGFANDAILIILSANPRVTDFSSEINIFLFSFLPYALLPYLPFLPLSFFLLPVFSMLVTIVRQPLPSAPNATRSRFAARTWRAYHSLPEGDTTNPWKYSVRPLPTLVSTYSIW